MRHLNPLMLAMAGSLAAAGCAGGGSGGDAAPSFCPSGPVRVEAWVNRMPGPDARARLIVIVDPGAAGPFRLVRAGDSGSAVELNLERAPSGAPAPDDANPVRYVEAVSANPDAVVILCKGREIARTGAVPSVY